MDEPTTRSADAATMRLRAATPDDFAAVLALNHESVAVLSALDETRLRLLDRQSTIHWVVERDGEVLAFLLAFREGSAYDSANYRWFAGRYAKFLYVDRVVVARHAHTLGIGSRLYAALFAAAADAGVPVVTCEYDIDPPNPVSQRFHSRRGFEEVGRQRVAGGKKQVSLQAAAVPVVRCAGSASKPHAAPTATPRPT